MSVSERLERHQLRAAGLVPCGVCEGSGRVLAEDDHEHGPEAGAWEVCGSCFGQCWVRPEPVMPEADRSPEPWEEWDQ